MEAGVGGACAAATRGEGAGAGAVGGGIEDHEAARALEEKMGMVGGGTGRRR